MNPIPLDNHIWEATTNTMAAWKCKKCDAVGFSPHPLPVDGCAPTEVREVSA